MTDKEIIIDGVNVSECQFLYSRWSGSLPPDSCSLWEETNPDTDNPIYKCKCHKDCYYKQLQHKEQECEALQLSENEAKEIIAELRQKLKILKMEIDTAKENYAHQKDCTELYYKALKKIEDIFDNDDWGYCPLDNREDCHYSTFLKMRTIINEVKNGTIQTKI